MSESERRSTSGLSRAAVEDRRRNGLLNQSPRRTSRSMAAILRANVFTLFNLVIAVLCVLAVWFGGWKQGLFGLVIIANTAIGVFQEYRAKRTLDALVILNEEPARVRRAGEEETIPPTELVRDDLVLVGPGDSIIADGRLQESHGLEIDESLLTGEAEPVAKSVDDQVRSGSFVVAGTGSYIASKVGREGYAARLVERASRFSLASSPLRDGINRFIRGITWIMIPVAALLIFNQLRSDQGFDDSVVGTVAGIVPMIPEGLVLLTSIAFAMGVIRLAERRCLVQELPAIEGLARIDTLCIDKTGTLTEGGFEVQDLSFRDDTGRTALAALVAADDSPNPTIRAIADHLADEEPQWTVEGSHPFSSARKWSGVTFRDHGHWVLGAPEVLLPEDDRRLREAMDLAAGGLRVLAVATADRIDPEDGPVGTTGVGLVVLRQRLRDTAQATLEYFGQQGVTVKILSGDNADSVAAVARSLGVEGADDPIDARQLPGSGPELTRVLDEHSVFGRVTPQQKRQFIAALRDGGHTVAMTGDGVNDVLALKDADLGVAMGSGSPAARSVAKVVLLDDDFASLPHLVDEGRRVIGNIERVANLFLTKTVYSILLALMVGLFAVPYPFLPLHITLIGSLTIGIPAFFLALAPSAERARPDFVGRVMRFAIPAGIVTAAATFIAYALVRGDQSQLRHDQSTAALTLFLVALAVLALVAKPPTPWRMGLVATMAAAFVLVLLVPWLRDFFMLEFALGTDTVIALVSASVAIAVLVAGLRFDRWLKDQPPLSSH
ncbi:cation-transporting ATPase E [Stackebrandtia endophytica]|uniref:Cation-transporting ATPase E n=1 Tax=Stackebrandtia endophytica TaxID=1496996 RepID=A0A543B1I5_9ACTN|nr:HAD-IC family P-type ATPase [Stackebrandtia endophytica]TQL78695.1 cation-transporting ATPase E [Stackebrandtia endophytica]